MELQSVSVAEGAICFQVAIQTDAIAAAQVSDKVWTEMKITNKASGKEEQTEKIKHLAEKL